MSTNVPDEALERICGAIWNDSNMDGVVLLDVYRHDAINCTASGTVEIDDKTYGFIIDDGNWEGTVVRAWGDPEDVGVYRPQPKERLTFIFPHSLMLLKQKSPAKFRAAIRRYGESWFKQKVGALNYDMHFAPGTKTRQHYAEWARGHSMTIGYLSEFEPEIRDAIEKVKRQA